MPGPKLPNLPKFLGDKYYRTINRSMPTVNDFLGLFSRMRGINDVPMRQWNEAWQQIGGRYQLPIVENFLRTGIKHNPNRGLQLEREMTQEIGNAMRKQLATGMPLNIVPVETPNGIVLRYLPGNPEEVGRTLYGFQNGSIDLNLPTLYRATGIGEGDLNWRAAPRTALTRQHKMFAQDSPGLVWSYLLSQPGKETEGQALMYDTLSGINPFSEVASEAGRTVIGLYNDMQKAITDEDIATATKLFNQYLNLPALARDPQALQRLEHAMPARNEVGRVFEEDYNKPVQKYFGQQIKSTFTKAPNGRIVFNPESEFIMPSGLIDVAPINRGIQTAYFRPGTKIMDIPVRLPIWKIFPEKHRFLVPAVDKQMNDFFTQNGWVLPQSYTGSNVRSTDLIFKTVQDQNPNAQVLRLQEANDYKSAHTGKNSLFTNDVQYPPVIGVSADNLNNVVNVGENTEGLYKRGGKINRFKSKLRKSC